MKQRGYQKANNHLYINSLLGMTIFGLLISVTLFSISAIDGYIDIGQR